MSEILLLSMPYGKSYGKMDIEDLDFGLPPVGIAYIASFLKKAGCDVKLVDLMFCTSSWQEARNLIKEESPKWIGLTATTPQISEAFKAAKLIKEINQDFKVVIGGIHASALPEETISDPHIDILVYGEGEMTMLELVSGKDLEDIQGIYYKSGDEIIKNPPRPLEKDLDNFPYPFYDDLPIHKYGSDHVGSILGLMCSRGCPFHCIYCAANTIHERKFRKRSTENILGEIEKMKYSYSLKKFSFYDDTFTLIEKRTVEMCESLIKKDYGLEWNCATRADKLNKPLLKLMKAAGCTMVQIGIESGCDEILELSKRKEKVEDAINAAKWAKEVGMEVVGLFILGLPHETEETIKQTIQIAKKAQIDYAQFSILVPLPGSEVWDMAKKGDLLKLHSKNWEDFGRYGESIISLRDVSQQQLSKYFLKAYREFYLRPSYILKRAKSIRSLHDLLGLSKKGLALAKLLK